MIKKLVLLGAISIIAVFCLHSQADAGMYPGYARETLEDFDGRSLVTSWWTSDSEEPYVYTLNFGNTEETSPGNNTLRVDYDKNNDLKSIMII